MELYAALSQEKRLEYAYDFGNGWEITITVENGAAERTGGFFGIRLFCYKGKGKYYESDADYKVVNVLHTIFHSPFTFSKWKKSSIWNAPKKLSTKMAACAVFPATEIFLMTMRQSMPCDCIEGFEDRSAKKISGVPTTASFPRYPYMAACS